MDESVEPGMDIGSDVALRKVEANKAFTMRGVEYKPGDLVDTTGLPDLKISQLLNQRWLRPARAGDI